VPVSDAADFNASIEETILQYDVPREKYDELFNDTLAQFPALTPHQLKIISDGWVEDQLDGCIRGHRPS